VPRLATKPAKDRRLKAIGERVRKARNERGLSQEGFSDRVGLDRTYVSGIERGVRAFSVLVLLDIASALKVKPEDLLP
jgi:transcriptional regulator with XRE-family HTH domain